MRRSVPLISRTRRYCVEPSGFRGLCTSLIQRRRCGNEHSQPPAPGIAIRSRSASTFNPTAVTKESTIYALSTASGRAGIAIVRVSGPACLDIYRGLCPSQALPKPRYASVRTLYDPKSIGNILDTEALVLCFPATKTVTGEDVLEFHVHGGPATVKAVLSAIPLCNSSSPIRYAEPGEFTRRAFQNDRLDLAQVEALGDTLSAETEQQRRSAVKGQSGALGKKYEEWRQLLLYARGEVEAIIDFSDDQDFDVSSSEMLRSIELQVRNLKTLIDLHIEAGRRGELLRNGIRISMLGPPNTGKSSLLNRIARREASIVSSEAGTTRDIVEVSFDMEGYFCTFADTAGLRISTSSSLQGPPHPSENPIGTIEQEGIKRAKQKAKDSDIIIVLASIEAMASKRVWALSYDAEALQIASESQGFVVVVNKTDVIPRPMLDDLMNDFRDQLASEVAGFDAKNLIAISCKDMSTESGPNGSGNIKCLVNRLASIFKDLTESEHEDMYGVTERQKQLLYQCNQALECYLEEASKYSAFDEGCDIVLAAEHLRSAAACLARITGRGEAGDVEEVLGVVFEKFCVGK